jgi:hypothetical protein
MACQPLLLTKVESPASAGLFVLGRRFCVAGLALAGGCNDPIVCSKTFPAAKIRSQPSRRILVIMPRILPVNDSNSAKDNRLDTTWNPKQHFTRVKKWEGR